tara:strand:+ start:1254 stop:2336 length:1083 start_codon:yes stop_codon:yes gene_type:complete
MYSSKLIWRAGQITLFLGFLTGCVEASATNPAGRSDVGNFFVNAPPLNAVLQEEPHDEKRTTTSSEVYAELAIRAAGLLKPLTQEFLDLVHGIDTRLTLNGATALLIAIENLRPEAVKLLLKNGADPNLGYPNRYKASPIAVLFESFDGYLRRFDPPPEDTSTACAEWKKPALTILGLLIRYGGEINSPVDEKGNQKETAVLRTLVSIPYDCDTIDIAYFLKKNGANTNIKWKTKEGTQTLLGESILMFSNGIISPAQTPDLINFLIDNGADVTKEYGREGNAIHQILPMMSYKCRRDSSGTFDSPALLLLRRFLNEGVPKNEKGNFGRTPYEILEGDRNRGCIGFCWKGCIIAAQKLVE